MCVKIGIGPLFSSLLFSRFQRLGWWGTGGGALCQCERPLSTGREKWIIGAMNSLSHVMISSLLQRNLETPENPDASKPGRVHAQGGVLHCAHIFAHLMLQPHLRRSENVPIPANGSVHSSERCIYM